MKINEIDWQPISELKIVLEVPPGCYALALDKDGYVCGMRFGLWNTYTDYAIIRKPVPSRVLKACPFK